MIKSAMEVRVESSDRSSNEGEGRLTRLIGGLESVRIFDDCRQRVGEENRCRVSKRGRINAIDLKKIFLLLLVCPFNIVYRSNRYCFLRILRNIVLAPIYKVDMVDFFLADQLCSQVAETEQNNNVYGGKDVEDGGGVHEKKENEGTHENKDNQ